MRLLITGGAGFIGSALIRWVLRETGHFVVNLDKLTYAANLDSLSEVLPSERYAFVRADVADSAALVAAFDTYAPDSVIHLAAESHVDRSIDGPGAFIQTNVVGTYALLETARDYWRALPAGRRERFRFLHVSTDEVFGSLGAAGRFDESSRYAPNSPYSASKAGADMLARAWWRTYGLPVIITNCSNNYGPYQFPEKLIPVVILAALEGRPIPVYGSGSNVRDWLFVTDHARALTDVVERGEPGEVYAIGGGQETSNIDLVRRLCAILDEIRPASGHRPHEKLIQFVPDRLGHDLRYAVDSTKIGRTLGWQPSLTIEQGLRQTVAWYLENEWWWRPIRAQGHGTERLGLGIAAGS